MSGTKKVISLILVVLFNILPFNGSINAQTSSHALYKPSINKPGEYFRVIIAFAQFASDTVQYDAWPLNEQLTWRNDLIDTAVSRKYRDETLSDYFNVASLGKFDFIGDVYQDTIVIPNDMSYGEANKYVLEKLNKNIKDFSRYDNWGYKDGQFLFNPGHGDGYLDMIIIIYRNADFPKFGLVSGIANLALNSDFITHDSIKIQSNYLTGYNSGGLTSKKAWFGGGKFGFISHLAHEFGHYLFGGGHTNFGGLMMGAPYPYETSTYIMNAWERSWLGYINLKIPSSNGEIDTLRDFVTTGDAFKIPVPFNNPSSSTFFIVENHQRLSKYDQIIRGGSLGGGNNFSTKLGCGLYIWLVTNGNNWAPMFDIKSADGAWDWVLDGTFYQPGFYSDGIVPKTKRSAVNRDHGKSDRYPWHIWWKNKWASKWVDINPFTKNYELTRNVMGDSTDAFNIGYNEIFSPWSNPGSFAGMQDSISLRVMSQQGNNIIVKFCSTYDSALAMPPSKPQNLRISINGQNHPVLTWEKNIEPDLFQYKIYYASTADSTKVPADYINYINVNAFNNGNPVTEWPDEHRNILSGTDRLYYKISAVDSTLQESVLSDYDWISFSITKSFIK